MVLPKTNSNLFPFSNQLSCALKKVRHDLNNEKINQRKTHHPKRERKKKLKYCSSILVKLPNPLISINNLLLFIKIVSRYNKQQPTSEIFATSSPWIQKASSQNPSFGDVKKNASRYTLLSSYLLKAKLSLFSNGLLYEIKQMESTIQEGKFLTCAPFPQYMQWWSNWIEFGKE